MNLGAESVSVHRYFPFYFLPPNSISNLIGFKTSVMIGQITHNFKVILRGWRMRMGALSAHARHSNTLVLHRIISQACNNYLGLSPGGMAGSHATTTVSKEGEGDDTSFIRTVSSNHCNRKCSYVYHCGYLVWSRKTWCVYNAAVGMG